MPQEYPIILRGFPGTVTKVAHPLGDLYLPVEAARPLPVIIFLADDPPGEGPDLTRFFAERGFAMLRIKPSDLTEAIGSIQANAAEYGLNADRIGLWGLGCGASASLSVADGVKAIVAAYPGATVVAAPPAAPPLLLIYTEIDTAAEALIETFAASGREVTVCVIESLPPRFLEQNSFDQGHFPRVRKREYRPGHEPLLSEAPPFTFGTIETFFRRWL